MKAKGFARTERLGIAVAAAATFVLAVALVAAAPAHADETSIVRLFGSQENSNPDIAPFPKWTGVLRRYAAERNLEDAPCVGACPLQRWNAFVAGLAGRDRLSQLEAVNAYANRVPYQTDQSRFGQIDYWATPREFFGRSGDCEDYAIAKYLSLRKLGWRAQDLRIAVIKDESRNELHAVLIAYLDGTAYVLDNLNSRVVEHAAIRHYRPIFSINEVAWHFHRDWNPNGAVMLAKARPARVPAAAPAAEQVVGYVPPAFDTIRTAPRKVPAQAARRAPARYADAAPLVRPARRSYAGRAGESLAELFTGASAR
ncbi:MAG: transglutaminase-like cysteine peptidase [Rhodospirillaceae bacterium]|nr:transglutaminase-like cysteine peptidase [Rhodospirillaceae bacterium]